MHTVDLTQTDFERTIAENDIVVNPLLRRGYLSIGCMPCTSPVDAGEDARAGRWRGADKTECGIHWAPAKAETKTTSKAMKSWLNPAKIT